MFSVDGIGLLVCLLSCGFRCLGRLLVAQVIFRTLFVSDDFRKANHDETGD